MQEKVMQPGSLQEPQEVENPIGGALYERYKKDGVYEYAKLPNGQKDKSRVKITYHRGTVYEGGINRGRYAGSGTYAWSDGSYYKGIFKNAMRVEERICGRTEVNLRERLRTGRF